jgi:TonB family protein
MQRQGRVKVEFTLFPNGTLTNLQVIRSCGTRSLDSAALAAVRLASPFQDVDHYLTHAKAFNIDVVFALDAEND